MTLFLTVIIATVMQCTQEELLKLHRGGFGHMYSTCTVCRVQVHNGKTSQ